MTSIPRYCCRTDSFICSLFLIQFLNGTSLTSILVQNDYYLLVILYQKLIDLQQNQLLMFIIQPDWCFLLGYDSVTLTVTDLIMIVQTVSMLYGRWVVILFLSVLPLFHQTLFDPFRYNSKNSFKYFIPSYKWNCESVFLW